MTVTHSWESLSPSDFQDTVHHPASDNYSITYQDGDSEVMSHSNVFRYVKSTKQYEDQHENQVALYSAFHTAVSSDIWGA